MKKILLSSFAAIAVASSASANSYLKANIGYNFFGEKTEKNLFKDNVALPENKLDKKLRDFNGGVSYGIKMNENFALEFIGDYTQIKSSKKDVEITNLNGFTGADNANVNAKESGFGMGVKTVGNQKINDLLSVNAGLGMGTTYKTFEYTENASKADKSQKFTLKSKSIIQPQIIASLGVDYIVSEGVTSGIEYNFKYGLKDSKYKVKSDTHKYKFENGSFIKDVKISEDTDMGKATRAHHSVAATLNFAF